MDAEDWAFLRKFGLFTLGFVAVLSAVIFYFHSTAEPVTPSTSSKTSHATSDYSGNVEFVDTDTLQQQQKATATKTATATAKKDNESSEGTFQVILILCMLAGVGIYIARGGRLGYLRQPWQTF